MTSFIVESYINFSEGELKRGNIYQPKIISFMREKVLVRGRSRPLPLLSIYINENPFTGYAYVAL